ncbi:Transposable element Tcb2, partial [Paramuricea clavata]
MNGNKPIPPSKDDELPGEPNNTSTATVIDNLTSTDNPATTGYMTTEDSTTTTTTKTRNKVLLQTAVTYAQGENGSNPIPVRLLLDSGSQRSYITNSLKKRLGLVPIRTETLNLNTFGDDHFKKRRCNI